MGKNIGKNISKNLSGKYSQKLLDYAKQYATVTLKTRVTWVTSKRVTWKIAQATGDLIGNKIAHKIIKSRKFQNIHNRIIQKQLQMSFGKKNLKKDIYL